MSQKWDNSQDDSRYAKEIGREDKWTCSWGYQKPVETVINLSRQT